MIDSETGEIVGLVNQVQPPFLRTAFNYDTNAASDASALHCLDKSLASQSERDETDINEIVRRFGITGKLPDNFQPPQYGDFTDIGDYRTALQAVRNAAESFMEMPAELRARFQNDPATLIDFLSDQANRAEAEKLGLVNPLPQPPVPLDLATAPTVETPVPREPTTS